MLPFRVVQARDSHELTSTSQTIAFARRKEAGATLRLTLLCKAAPSDARVSTSSQRTRSRDALDWDRAYRK